MPAIDTTLAEQIRIALFAAACRRLKAVGWNESQLRMFQEAADQTPKTWEVCLRLVAVPEESPRRMS